MANTLLEAIKNEMRKVELDVTSYLDRKNKAYFKFYSILMLMSSIIPMLRGNILMKR